MIFVAFDRPVLIGQRWVLMTKYMNKWQGGGKYYTFNKGYNIHEVPDTPFQCDGGEGGGAII